MTYASWFTYLITYEPVNQYFVKFKIIMKFNWSDIALFEYYRGNMNFDTINFKTNLQLGLILGMLQTRHSQAKTPFVICSVVWCYVL